MKRSNFSFTTILFASVLSSVFVFCSIQVEAQTIPAPSSISVSNPGQTSFTVNWIAPDTGGIAITGYDVEYRDASITGSSFVDAGHTGTTTSITITGLTRYTEYALRIRTLTANANSAWSTSVFTSTLSAIPAPSSLTASNKTTTGFDVSWTAPTTTETVTSYDVRYRPIGVSGSFVSTNTTNTQVTLSGLTPNITYEVQVRANSATESSIWTVSPNSLIVKTLAETVLSELGTPSNVTASNNTNTSFDVRWTAPTTTETITGYDVQYGINIAYVTTVSVTGTSTSLTGLTPNTGYLIQVRAKSANGKGAWSTTVYAATTSGAISSLPAPTGLTASNKTSTGFTVSWTEPTTTETITGYDVRYKVVSTATYTDAEHTGTDTSSTFTGLTPNTNYEFQVRTVISRGYSAWSATFYDATLTQYPIAAPTGLTVSNKTSTGFTVSWTAPTNTSGLTLTGYEVRYSIVSSATYTDAGHTGTDTSSTFTGLTPNTAYEAQVRAVAGNDTSVWSLPVYTATLTQYPIAAPTGLTVSNRTSTGFTVSWTAPTNTSGLTITGYDVRYKVVSSATYSDAGHTGTDTSFTFAGLTPNTSYKVQIRAVGGSDTSLWTSAVYTATLASTADAVPGLSSQELLQLGALLTYDTVIINELHNSSIDANDWLELRNVSGADLPLDTWHLTVRTADSNLVVTFPTGTVIPTGDVLLLTNTAGGREQSSLLQEDGEMATADDMSVLSVVSEAFVLPQAKFALVLRSPTVFGDIAGNYVQGEALSTTPAFTVDTAWDRTQPVAFGYRTEAWAKSTYQNGLGSPGYQPLAPSADVNSDGLVNIFDLVLVASQFGTTSTTADLNRDGTVNIADLALVAGALGPAIGAPTANQSAAAVVNNWLKLARENAANVVKSSIPAGFSYQRGIQVLEELARALTPNTTALLANYPNPFNPETWIPYQLAKATDVTLTIYASDGNLVRTLAIGHRDVGMYKTRTQAAYWDGKNALGESVASGVYFYTLTAGAFSATRKMLILK